MNTAKVKVEVLHLDDRTAGSKVSSSMVDGGVLLLKPLKKRRNPMIRMMACFTVVILTALSLGGCGYRVTYDKFVYDFESNCDGGARARVEHDPDPRERRVVVEPGHGSDIESGKIKEIIHEGPGLSFKMASGAMCTLLPGDEDADCYSMKAGDLTPACQASLKIVEFRRPSHDDGTEPSRVK